MSRKENIKKQVVSRGDMGGLWLLGFIGSLVYFLHYHSGTVWLVVVGIFKSLFWPAYLVYHLLQFMHI